MLCESRLRQVHKRDCTNSSRNQESQGFLLRCEREGDATSISPTNIDVKNLFYETAMLALLDL